MCQVERPIPTFVLTYVVPSSDPVSIHLLHPFGQALSPLPSQRGAAPAFLPRLPRAVYFYNLALPR